MSAATWAEFVWPDWVPQDVRAQVESFWGPPGHRVEDWEKSAKAPYNDGAELGTRGGFWSVGHRRIVIGRYVHAWNNMGRVVLDDGRVEVVSGGVATAESIRKQIALLQNSIDAARAKVDDLENQRAELLAFEASR